VDGWGGGSCIVFGGRETGVWGGGTEWLATVNPVGKIDKKGAFKKAVWGGLWHWQVILPWLLEGEKRGEGGGHVSPFLEKSDECFLENRVELSLTSVKGGTLPTKKGGGAVGWSRSAVSVPAKNPIKRRIESGLRKGPSCLPTFCLRKQQEAHHRRPQKNLTQKFSSDGERKRGSKGCAWQGRNGGGKIQ